MSSIIIGVDLGGTNAKTALVSTEKEIIAKDSRPTNAEGGPEAVMDVMEASVRDLLDQQGVSRERVLAVGFGAPGPMNWQTGVVYNPPNLPGWDNVPLGDAMSQRLGVPCFIENDANAAAYGEYWLGAGQGTECMVVLTLGTGLGGGIVVFGKLLRGIDGTAAELGHMTIQRDGRLCGCGAHGCLETYASVTGMVRTAVEGLNKGKTSLIKDLCQSDVTKLTGKMIFEAAEQDDKFARKVFKETATWLGLGIASIVNMLNPERVVLCGGMIAAGDLLFDPVRTTVMENAFEVPAKRCDILPAGLGADAGVIGAAGCAYDRNQAD